MALKDGTTSKNMLSRGLTSLLDSHKNKKQSEFIAAGPAAAAAATAAAAGFHNVPLARPKHHATEGRNNLQKHAAPSGFSDCSCWGLLLLLVLLELVPNVAFWTNKKPAPKCSSHPLKTVPQPSPSGRLRNSKTQWALKDWNNLQKHAAPKAWRPFLDPSGFSDCSCWACCCCSCCCWWCCWSWCLTLPSEPTRN